MLAADPTTAVAPAGGVSWGDVTVLADGIGTAVNVGVTVGVDRHRHPVVWWVFGAVPLAFRVVRLLKK